MEVVNQRVSLMWLPNYGKLSKTCWRISGEKIMIVAFSNLNIYCLTECIGVGFFLSLFGSEWLKKNPTSTDQENKNNKKNQTLIMD